MTVPKWARDRWKEIGWTRVEWSKVRKGRWVYVLVHHHRIGYVIRMGRFVEYSMGHYGDDSPHIHYWMPNETPSASPGDRSSFSASIYHATINKDEAETECRARNMKQVKEHADQVALHLKAYQTIHYDKSWPC